MDPHKYVKFFNDDPVVQLIIDQEQNTFKHTWNYKTSEGLKKYHSLYNLMGNMGYMKEDGFLIILHLTFLHKICTSISGLLELT